MQIVLLPIAFIPPNPPIDWGELAEVKCSISFERGELMECSISFERGELNEPLHLYC